ncbi:MAG TPA: molybdopterin cofactor-binding domain-containing protein, partial [Spirochaetia bacterium]
TGAGCVGQGIATVLTQIACQVLGLEPSRVRVVTPDTDATPDSGTATASRHTLITGEACRRACADLAEAARRAGIALDSSGPSLAAQPAGTAPGNSSFPFAALAGREFPAEYEAVTDPFDSRSTEPVHHVAYSYACQVVVLGPDRRVARVVAAHDSGLVVNPLAFEGQVEGGVVMGLGYALTESLRLERCVPTARYGQLGLLRAPDAPPVETIIVRKSGSGNALDGGVSGAAYGAKGIGEISTIPTAAAVANAYYALDGKERDALPLADTPYRAVEAPPPGATPVGR